MQVTECGSVFISRFPHYLEYMAIEADLFVYTVSVDVSESDAMGRPHTEYLNGLKNAVSLARQAHEEVSREREEGAARPKELIVVTGAEKYISHSDEVME